MSNRKRFWSCLLACILALTLCVPLIGYLSAYCFGDFYTRKFLTIPERELLTFAILAAQGGCEPQVKAHVGGNAAVGNKKETLLAALTVCLPYIGFPLLSVNGWRAWESEKKER